MNYAFILGYRRHLSLNCCEVGTLYDSWMRKNKETMHADGTLVSIIALGTFLNTPYVTLGLAFESLAESSLSGCGSPDLLRGE